MLTGKIRSQVDQVWNAFWTGGITDPITVISQITYLLFIRRLDDIQKNAERKAQITGKAIENPVFSENENHLRWSQFKDADPDTMFKQMQEDIFPKIKSLQSQGSFAEHMRDAIFVVPTPRLLDQVVQMIDAINMDDKDTKGDLYEYLLSKLTQSGVNGQFRTPRHIIRMMVNMMQPSMTDTICDPASGTCGFLMESVEYVNHHLGGELTKPANRAHFNQKMFHAYDTDQNMLRIGAMNMLLHGIDTPYVEYRDSLAEHEGGEIEEAYSLILANPPFKGSVDFDIIAPDLLRALGKTPASKKASTPKDGKKKKAPTEKSELLFLALMLRMLKPGGRAAVIVPDGVLFGSTKSHKSIRKKIIEEQKLQAVISLPSGVFKPYAGVSTAILIFTKTNSGGTDNVWFYDMQADGYSLDDKRTPLFDIDENGQQVKAPTHEQSNIADIETRFSTIADASSPELERARTEQSFMVDIADILANDYDLSINRYKEVVYEEVHYDPPQEILGRIKDLQQKMADGVAELEKLL